MKNFCDHISEISETTESESIRGWILYDADCRSCTNAARQFQNLFAKRGFAFLPLQTPWVQQRLGLDPSAPLEEMRVLTNDGRDFGGVDALAFLSRQIWWARPFAALAKIPPVYRLADRSYRWIAAHRGCTHVHCAIPHVRSWPGWLGFVLPLLAIFARKDLEPWIFMWLMAGSIFFACKGLTFWRARITGARPNFARTFSYLVLWPGMDAESFLRRPISNSTGITSRASARAVLFAVAKIFIGAAMLFGAARFAPHPLLAGWTGMIGLILILHFGIFDLAAIAWCSAGIDVRPIMNAPIRSTSLNEFWGRRWNGAFNQLVLDVFFRRVARSLGVIWATLIAFLISGLIHELVISVPARAGYGLPTAYFVLQGVGVVLQRKVGLRQGLAGWISTMFIVAGPAFWLFHPPFVRQIIIPFMHAIHAL